jgi:hypothetical protein
MSELSKVFALNRKGLNVPRAVAMAGVLLVPLIVLIATDQEKYLLSVVFAVLFAGLIDPGGEHPQRIAHLAEFGIVGAALNAVGFAIGGGAWGWVRLSLHS